MTYIMKVFSGDYPDRQRDANAWGAAAYYEQHCNALQYDSDGVKDNHCLTIVAHNASLISFKWASLLSSYSEQMRASGPLFPGKRVDGGSPFPGVLQRAHKEAGDYNLRFTDMPAILGEQRYVSDITQCTYILSDEGILDTAMGVAESIRHIFPDGGKIALSIGHLGKERHPYDRGAPCAKGVPNPRGWAEGEINEAIIDQVVILLSDDDAPRTESAPLTLLPDLTPNEFECPGCSTKMTVNIS